MAINIQSQSSLGHFFKLVMLMHLGSVIRCMRRLEELLRQMCQASKAIGNTELENKFAEGELIGH